MKHRTLQNDAIQYVLVHLLLVPEITEDSAAVEGKRGAACLTQIRY